MDAEPVFITGSVFSWESLLVVSIIVAAWFVCRRINVMKRPVCNGGCAGCSHCCHGAEQSQKHKAS